MWSGIGAEAHSRLLQWVKQPHGLDSSYRRIGDAFAAGFYSTGVALLVTGYAFDANVCSTDIREGVRAGSGLEFQYSGARFQPLPRFAGCPESCEKFLKRERDDQRGVTLRSFLL
jgi:hypothetical protein